LASPDLKQYLVNSTEHIPLMMELTEATHDWLETFNDPFLSYKRLIETVGDQEMPPPIERITPDNG
jgi:hypothetical protein